MHVVHTYERTHVMTFVPQTTPPWYLGRNVTDLPRHEVQAFCRSLITSQTYRDGLEARLLKGELPPVLESMLWYYAFGKPQEQVQVNVSAAEDLSTLSVQQLYERAKQVQDKLAEAKALEDALPTEFKVA